MTLYVVLKSDSISASEMIKKSTANLPIDLCSECYRILCGTPVACRGIAHPFKRFQALFLKPQTELESQVLRQTTQSDAELS